MAWQINATTIDSTYGPYDLDRQGRVGQTGRINTNAYSLIGSGTRTNNSIVKKRWSFKLFNVSTADSQAIEADILGGEFPFYDDYDSAWYTVKSIQSFSWTPLNRDKSLFTGSFLLEEA